MAYNETLADRIRKRLSGLPNVEEKKMMGGLTFMYNGKMCVGIIRNDLMCRIDPAIHDMAIQKPGCKTMEFTKRPMSGFIQVDETGTKSRQDFDYWIDLALDFNKNAKASKKTSSAKKASPSKKTLPAKKAKASKKTPSSKKASPSKKTLSPIRHKTH